MRSWRAVLATALSLAVSVLTAATIYLQRVVAEADDEASTLPTTKARP